MLLLSGNWTTKSTFYRRLEFKMSRGAGKMRPRLLGSRISSREEQRKIALYSDKCHAECGVCKEHSGARRLGPIQVDVELREIL